MFFKQGSISSFEIVLKQAAARKPLLCCLRICAVYNNRRVFRCIFRWSGWNSRRNFRVLPNATLLAHFLPCRFTPLDGCFHLGRLLCSAWKWKSCQNLCVSSGSGCIPFRWYYVPCLGARESGRSCELFME